VQLFAESRALSATDALPPFPEFDFTLGVLGARWASCLSGWVRFPTPLLTGALFFCRLACVFGVVIAVFFIFMRCCYDVHAIVLPILNCTYLQICVCLQELCDFGRL